MKTEIMSADHPIAIRHAQDILHNGGLVAFPTDTVYGLAALPFRAEYVERLYIAKGRNSERSIAILLGEQSQIKLVAKDLGEMASRLVEHFWPGPLTLIVPRLETLPETLSSSMTVGIRIPDHPFALALLRQTGPLAVTSANLSGYSNCNTAPEVLLQLGGRIHLILDGGQTTGGVPSTVVDCTGNELVILREGPLNRDDLQAVLSRN
jgi:L-threonylcarbamoyladenylate synthase